MKRIRPVVGSFAFLVLAPGVVAGLLPALISGWEGSAPATARVLGAVAVAVGAVTLLGAFARFAIDGLGTPAPPAPTECLVVSGVYRHVRNPMYLAVVAIILGQAAIFASLALVLYAAIVLACFIVFVRRYEQPTLRRRYGADYDSYCEAVPGWLPQLRPWDEGGEEPALNRTGRGPGTGSGRAGPPTR